MHCFEPRMKVKTNKVVTVTLGRAKPEPKAVRLNFTRLAVDRPARTQTQTGCAGSHVREKEFSSNLEETSGWIRGHQLNEFRDDVLSNFLR